jgi:ligand-binding SRPBCC domain-containing protein
VRSFLLEREQWVPRPRDEVFAFFADAGNLERITPSWLGFRIRTPRPIAMRPGALIEYRIYWHGLPLRWLTEIEQWEPPCRFTDVQRRGPYTLWHHTHEFWPHEGGTQMRNRVRYALPLGFVGALMHRWFVRQDLEAIFAYRAARIDEIFGDRPV